MLKFSTNKAAALLLISECVCSAPSASVYCSAASRHLCCVGSLVLQPEQSEYTTLTSVIGATALNGGMVMVRLSANPPHRLLYQ